MTFHISSNIFVPTAESYAKSALATLPYARRTCGYWSHGFQVGSVRLVKFKTAYGGTVVKLNMYTLNPLWLKSNFYKMEWTIPFLDKLLN